MLPGQYGAGYGAGTKSNVHEVMRHLKDELAKHGARGIIGLGRKFKVCDIDNSKTLNHHEFRSGLAKFGLQLRDADINSIYEYLDSDGDGMLSFDEFLVGVRGEMNQRRLRLVSLAFSQFDKNHDGAVHVEELVGVYNGKKHPDVIERFKKLLVSQKNADAAAANKRKRADLSGMTEEELRAHQAELKSRKKMRVAEEKQRKVGPPQLALIG